ncbi:putative deoxyribonuclease RhsA [Corynebacterium auriscanis]|nr:putative deoxyribonuclease RhsA [Corynebacterium auriscanis]
MGCGGSRVLDVADSAGVVAGQVVQSLYGTRKWVGAQASPLLFTGQYEDTESGWVYNRFRFYQPVLGSYNAQDPLGLAPRVASGQGYVDHAAHWVDALGLMAHKRTISATDRGYLRGGPYARLETANLQGGAAERHHIISQEALKANGFDPAYAPAIQMEKGAHKMTLSHGAQGQFGRIYRQYESDMIANDRMDDLVLDELIRIEQMPDHIGTDRPLEALNSYLDWKENGFGFLA